MKLAGISGHSGDRAILVRVLEIGRAQFPAALQAEAM
jgi:hypothetical protein